MIPCPKPGRVGSLFAESEPPGLAETLVCSSSRQMCLRGHVSPARFRLIVIRILRFVDNGDAVENILRAGSAAPAMPIRDRRILLPATLAWVRFVPVEFGVSVMPGWGIRGWDVSPYKFVCRLPYGSCCPSCGGLNHRTVQTASLTRDVAC